MTDTLKALDEIEAALRYILGDASNGEALKAYDQEAFDLTSAGLALLPTLRAALTPPAEMQTPAVNGPFATAEDCAAIGLPTFVPDIYPKTPPAAVEDGELRRLMAERDRMKEALEELQDGDFNSRGVQMIVRAALGEQP